LSPSSNTNTSGLNIRVVRSAWKRRKKSFGLTFAIAGLISLLTIVLFPASYQSRSTILIEQQEIPQDLVRSTVTSYADQRIEVISQRVMTTANLWEIIKKYDLYQDELERETRERVINDMREDAIERRVISAEVVDPRSGRPTEATIAFQLAFTYENAKLAQRVANELTSLFLSENLKSRSQMAEQASEFLDSETEKLGKRVAELEAELASFKEKNFEALPELTELNLGLLDRTEQALLDNQRQIALVEERISYLRTELAQIDSQAPSIQSDGAVFLSNAARLKAINTQLQQAESRYSDSHPQVQRLKEELSNLMGVVENHEAPRIKTEIYRRQRAQLLQRYTAEHPSVIALTNQLDSLEALSQDALNAPDPLADNPAYIQVKGQLEAAMIEVEGLQSRALILKSDLKKYEQRLTQAPRIEQAYQSLQRDYQTTTLKYAEVRAKQQEAALGRSLESEQKGERFTLIEPPLVPEEAHSPNRKLLAVLGLFLTLGSSIGIVFLKELIDPSIRGRDRLQEVVGAAPLAVIPFITTPGEVMGAQRQKWLAVAAISVALVSALVLFHIFVKPLDVTWYVALRKFGLM
jgi:succinoglycan biosynthesis transport protein ExoP